MQSHPENSLKVERENLFRSVLPIIIASSPSSSSASSDTQDSAEEDDFFKQLVLYNPLTNDNPRIEPIPDPIKFQHSPLHTYSALNAPRVLPSVGAFTVQCAECFKWRLIPTKQKYEEIRERILEVPFLCELAREWRPDISCQDPEDISQDDSKLWVIDKPDIAQPPPGWQRLLRIRGEGCTRFADVYYMAPSGKRLRSMVDIRKYLADHPEYISDGVTMSQFSFQTPKPLQENYVRKRTAHGTTSYDGSKSRPLELAEANPISWASPNTSRDLQLEGGTPSLPPPTYDGPVNHPAKKQARTPFKQHRTVRSFWKL